MTDARLAAEAGPPPDRTRGRQVLGAVAALALGSLLALALGETAARLVGPTFGTATWTRDYDPLLGFVPQPGSRARPEARWHVNIDAQGLRENGGPRPAGLPILAVGDSYTFGEEMEDDQTWPAFLERELHAPVLNAGVSAYGLDQIVLRAERLLAARRVRAMLVSFIPDDVLRCQCSVFGGRPKPYFDVQDGRLALRNVPVPQLLVMRPWGRELVPRSRLLAWIHNVSHPNQVRAHAHGQRVARLLIARLGEQARRGVPVLLLVQGPIPPGQGRRPRFEEGTLPSLRELEQVAAHSGMPSLNLVEAAWQESRKRPGRRAELYLHEAGGHMTAEGNAWAARQVAVKLRELGWVER